MIAKTEQTFEFDAIDDVVSDIAKGRIVIVTDDADRENEGDLVMEPSWQSRTRNRLPTISISRGTYFRCARRTEAYCDGQVTPRPPSIWQEWPDYNRRECFARFCTMTAPWRVCRS